MKSGGNVADGIMRGSTVTTTATVATIANPIGAELGAGSQLATDLIKGEISSPEAYAGAMLGGAVALNGESEIIANTAMTGLIAGGVHKLVPMIEFDMDFYLKKVLTDYEKNWIESILSGTVNGVYYRVKKEIWNGTLDNKN